ncbi:hypothetical protein B0T14DRAFT_409681, partial [Immersiella caudata]
DLYTPQWIRGHGNNREGWCGFCKPGKWLSMRSGFWYHKTFTHGINSSNGCAFKQPQSMRLRGGTWEGRCSRCQKWIRLKGGVVRSSWFHHEHKVS